MRVQTHHLPGRALGRPMELREFGDRGQPILAFPSQDGHVGDFEGFGMIHACASLIEAGRVRFLVLDGNDWESWTNQGIHAAERVKRHRDYERWVLDEVLPLAREGAGTDRPWTTGCSMGAFHAANFFFRHPDLFGGVVGISGLYDTGSFVGDHFDDEVYFNSPIKFLPGLRDEAILAAMRRGSITFMVGQGAWEEDCLRDTRALETALASIGVPAWFDYWGHDVNHDWPWWRQMLPYALGRRVP